MISVAWNRDDDARQELERVPGLVTQALSIEPAVEAAAARHREMTRCVVLGRGYNYASAHEWALKLTELTYVVAIPYSSADFMHGPVAMLDRDFPVLAVAPQGAILKELAPLLGELRRSQVGTLLAISNHPDVLQLASTPLVLPPDIPEWLSPLVDIAPAQLFCLHLGMQKGLDVEHPRGLQKVTKTW
jgi:glutamine---fructose-6-phosphate transaminase (isomerizing)